MRTSVSVKDVAAAARVSVTTVSNVLNQSGRVSEETAERVRQAVRELKFVRNDAARQLRAGQSRSIGLSVIDLANPYFVDLARGADRRAREDNVQILIANSDRDEERQRSYLSLFEEQRLRGVIISPTGTPPPELTRLRDRGIPSVLVDREVTDPGFSSVSVDDVAGGYLAVRHLLDSGRRNISFVGSPSTTKQAADRLAGARAAVSEFSGASLHVINMETATIAGGRTAGIALREPGRTDAVFTANDVLAVGILQSVVGHLRIPEDLAIIGYDDIELAATSSVPLSSIRQPTELVGWTAADLLLRDSGEPDEHIVFQPELVIRSSTSG